VVRVARAAVGEAPSQEDEMQRLKRKLSYTFVAVLAIAMAMTTAGSGVATPPVDATSVLLGQGVVSSTDQIRSQAGTDVVVAKNTFAPKGSSGWHSHPGIAVVVVRKGEITLAKEPIGGGPCRVHTYHAGQTFLERPDNLQNGTNRGDHKTVVIVTFFRVPHGGSARIDQPAPRNCP
jgi:quercetin dioxygenase-like cupin family protein